MFAFILQQFIVKQRKLQNSVACKNRNWQVGHGIKWNSSFWHWSFILLLTVKAQLHVLGLGDKKQGH